MFRRAGAVETLTSDGNIVAAPLTRCAPTSPREKNSDSGVPVAKFAGSRQVLRVLRHF